MPGKQKIWALASVFLNCVNPYDISVNSEQYKIDFLPLYFRIRSFVVPEIAVSESPAQDSEGADGEQLYHPPEIIPLYGISSKMAPLFQESGYK